MKCPYCESIVNDSAATCPVCGSALTSSRSSGSHWQQPSFGDLDAQPKPERPEPVMSFNDTSQPVRQTSPVQPNINIRPSADQPPSRPASENKAPVAEPAKKGPSFLLAYGYDIKKLLVILLVIAAAGYLLYDYYRSTHFDFEDGMIGEWQLTAVEIDSDKGGFDKYTGFANSHMTITKDSIEYNMSKNAYAKVNDGESEWTIDGDITRLSVKKKDLKYKSKAYQYSNKTTFTYSDGKIKQRVKLENENAIFIWEKK